MHGPVRLVIPKEGREDEYGSSSEVGGRYSEVSGEEDGEESEDEEEESKSDDVSENEISTTNRDLATELQKTYEKGPICHVMEASKPTLVMDVGNLGDFCVVHV